MINRRLLFFVLTLVALYPAARAVDRLSDLSSGKAPATGDMVLFPFDDNAIPWRENLKVTLQRPTKYSDNPIMKAGPIEGPEGYGTLLYGTVIKLNGKYKMWYLASPRTDSRIRGDAEWLGDWRPIAYAESEDGIHWIEPNLGLVEFRGNKNNNLVEIGPSTNPYHRNTDFVSVWYDRQDPDVRQRYKMSYIAIDAERKACVTATAISTDGIRWTLMNDKPIQQGHFENTSLIKFNGLYYISGQNIPPFDGSLMDGSGAGRVMKVFFSPDFKHWSGGRALAWHRSDYVQAPTNFGYEGHMGAGLWDRGNVILGFNGLWQGDLIHKMPDSPLAGLKINLGLIISNDAIHYREPVPNFIMVPHGDPQDWDSNALLEANAFANTDTETLIWYSHWYTSRPNHVPPLPQQLDEANTSKADRIGLLTLPRDRFGYFSKLLPVSQDRNPADDIRLESSCLSRPLKFDRPGKLYVNIDDVKPDAPLKIALVDDTERPLVGYTAQLDVNSLKATVHWAGSKQSIPSNRPFRVKVIWPANSENGKLYAIYIELQ
jgi:hypothetical protein